MCGFIMDVATPAKPTIGAVRTDWFEEDFQVPRTEKNIRHEVTAPIPPHFNAVAESALGLLTEKAIAMLETSKEANDNRL